MINTGNALVVDVSLPRYRARLTAYLPNGDGSSTCVGVECDHYHTEYREASACLDRLRRRVERRPESVPAVAAELRRRGAS